MKGFSPAYDTTVRYAAVDWARNLRTLPGSLILRRIKSPLLFNIAITFFICLLHATVKATGRVWPTVIPLPHTLLSSALGLLLVFRTNAAYDRFWEARKQWGIVTTECRSRVKVPPAGQHPSSAPAPLQGAPGGSGQLGTPRKRPTHWAPQPLPRLLERAASKP